MTGHEIRQGFLDYFARHGHRVVPSSSLVPADDPTLLFTNAGMNQFKDLFLGRERRDYRRATTAQKCMRVSGKHNDLDNVGPSLRHHTFFEMLGNFSFGDYFKTDAIPFAWELLTTVWKLEPDRLFPTMFKGEAGIPRDDEAFELWTTLGARRRGSPSSGSRTTSGRWATRGPAAAARRSIISAATTSRAMSRSAAASSAAASATSRSGTTCSWSSTAAKRGTLTPLPAPSIDTGMGLERITSVIQGKLSTYDTDLFPPILDAIGERAGRPYTGAPRPDRSPRRVDARHRRPPARDDVPHRRRRPAVERVARLCAAQDHAARDAPRQEARPHRAVPAHARRRRRSRDGRELSGARASSATRSSGPSVSEEDRFDAVLTSGLPKLEELLDRTRTARRGSVGAGRRGLPAVRLARRAARFRRGPRRPARACDRPGGLRTRPWRRSASVRGPAARSNRRKAFPSSTPATPTARRSKRSAISFEGYTTTDVPDATVVALFDDGRRQVNALETGSTGLSCSTARRSTSSPAARSRTRASSFTPTVAPAAVVGMTRLWPGGPRAHRVHCRGGRSRRAPG